MSIPTKPKGRFPPRLSSNRMIDCNRFLHASGHRLPGAVSSSRSAWSRRMVGLRRGTFQCVERTHGPDGAGVQQPRRNGSRHVPAGTSRHVERLTWVCFGSGHGFGFPLECLTRLQHGMHDDRELSGHGNGGPFEADPLTRSFSPQARNVLSALALVRTTVAAS